MAPFLVGGTEAKGTDPSLGTDSFAGPIDTQPVLRTRQATSWHRAGQKPQRDGGLDKFHFRLSQTRSPSSALVPIFGGGFSY